MKNKREQGKFIRVIGGRDSEAMENRSVSLYEAGERRCIRNRQKSKEFRQENVQACRGRI